MIHRMPPLTIQVFRMNFSYRTPQNVLTASDAIHVKEYGTPKAARETSIETVRLIVGIACAFVCVLWKVRVCVLTT